MADKISANITYVDTDNNKGSKAITDISPTADNGAIKDFCVGLIGLTTNTLSQIDRVEKTDITNATPKPKFTFPVVEEALANLQLGKSDSILWEGIAVWNSTKANLPKIYCTYSYTQGNVTYTDLSMKFGFGVEQMLDMADPSNCRLMIYLAKGTLTADDTLIVDFICTETPVTRETMYRLTITGTPGEATFVQL